VAQDEDLPHPGASRNASGDCSPINGRGSLTSSSEDGAPGGGGRIGFGDRAAHRHEPPSSWPVAPVLRRARSRRLAGQEAVGETAGDHRVGAASSGSCCMSVAVAAEDRAGGLEPRSAGSGFDGPGLVRSISSTTVGRVLQEAEHTPTHGSWLNQVELWFSLLSRRILRYGNFAFRQQLAEAVERFIQHWNLADAKPFRWTYEGRPLVST